MSRAYEVDYAPDCFLLDTDAKLTVASATTLRATGARGIIRYVGISAAEPNDIDAGELAMLLGIFDGVMLVQHVRNPGWIPTASMGVADGTFFARRAGEAGYLPDAHLWDDLEGIGDLTWTGRAATIVYANKKLELLEAAGYPQGEYIGDDVPLSGAALFTELRTTCYWRSLSLVPNVDTRGYAMRQLTTVTIGGVEVDVSYHGGDRLGGRARWMRKAA